MALERVLSASSKALGAGVVVQRYLPRGLLRKVGPWVFFDYLPFTDFPAGGGVNIRPHPHIGLATVTHLLCGEILHQDSLGSVQVVEAGSLSLMVAGKGIVHSERERPEFKSQPHQQHMLQFWLALPQAQETMEPEYHYYPAAQFVSTVVQGVSIKVLMGQAYGMTSPVKTLMSTLLLEVRLKQGQTWDLCPIELHGETLASEEQASKEWALFVIEGQLRSGKAHINPQQLARITPDSLTRLEATQNTYAILLGGSAIGTRYLDWNFVSSQPKRLEEAKRAWQAGLFPIIPSDHGD